MGFGDLIQNTNTSNLSDPTPNGLWYRFVKVLLKFTMSLSINLTPKRSKLSLKSIARIILQMEASAVRPSLKTITARWEASVVKTFAEDLIPPTLEPCKGGRKEPTTELSFDLHAGALGVHTPHTYHADTQAVIIINKMKLITLNSHKENNEGMKN